MAKGIDNGRMHPANRFQLYKDARQLLRSKKAESGSFVPLSVDILVLPESMLSTVTGPLDVLTAAGAFWPRIVGEPAEPRFAVQVVGLSRAPLTYPSGLTLQPQRDLADDRIADIVYVPSLALAPGAPLSDTLDQAARWLRGQHRGGALLCSVCTGAYALAQAGLLDGLPAATHWAFQRDFARRFPAVKLRENAVLVPNEAQRIVTGGGGASWHDLVYYLTRRASSIDVADQIRNLFLLHGHEFGQGAYARDTLMPTAVDAEVAKAQRWLQGHMGASNPVRQVVACSALAERTLKRRFKKHVGMSIIEYVKVVRISRAKDLLVKSALAVDAIAHEVGYQDASFFRRIFRADAGLTPSRFRERFGNIEVP